METNIGKQILASSLFMIIPVAIILLYGQTGCAGSWILMEFALSAWAAWSGVCLAKHVRIPCWLRWIFAIAALVIYLLLCDSFIYWLPMRGLMAKFGSFILLGWACGNSIKANDSTVEDAITFVVFLVLNGFVEYTAQRTEMFSVLLESYGIHLWIPSLVRYFSLISMLGAIYYCVKTALSSFVVKALSKKWAQYVLSAFAILTAGVVLAESRSNFLLILIPSIIVITVCCLQNKKPKEE